MQCRLSTRGSTLYSALLEVRTGADGNGKVFDMRLPVGGELKELDPTPVLSVDVNLRQQSPRSNHAAIQEISSRSVKSHPGPPCLNKILNNLSRFLYTFCSLFYPFFQFQEEGRTLGSLSSFNINCDQAIYSTFLMHVTVIS